MKKPNKTRMAEILLIALFLIAIWSPIFDMVLQLAPDTKNAENREMANFPKIADSNSFKAFPEKFEDYFDDNFGLRKSLIMLYSRLNIELIHTSIDKSVIVGDDGWFYQYGKYSPPPKNEKLNLFSKIKADLDSRKKWFSERGIGYYVMLVPQKNAIYSEYLPSHWGRFNSTLEVEFYEFYKNDSQFGYWIDVYYPVMKVKEKTEAPLFYKTDTHWNDIGGYVAYYTLLKAMNNENPGLFPVPMDNFNIAVRDNFSGDLVGKISLKDYIVEKKYVLTPKIPRKAKILYNIFDMPYWNRTDISECANCSNLTAVVIGDSQMVAIMPFLSEHFSKVTYIWRINCSNNDYIFGVIDSEHPDIVIDENMYGKTRRIFSCPLPPKNKTIINSGAHAVI